MGSEDLYRELWKACAGPLVDVPRDGERVYYFPQGHIEQVNLFQTPSMMDAKVLFFFSKKKFVMAVYSLMLL